MPDEVNNGRREVAFRIPAHPLTLSLLHQLDFPLVAPSANLFGTVSPTQPDHVFKNFNGQIPYILDGGPCDVGIESTVVGFNKNGDPVIYRHGAVTAENIEAIAGAVQARYPDNDTVSPGMLPYHYSPKTPFFLSQMVMPDPFDDINRMGAIRFCQYHPLIPRKNQFILSQAGSLQEAAKNLYKAMHLLDEMGLQKIFAEKLPDTGLGKAINDRLHKAANQYRLKNSVAM
jgi:L-threonylcarbamoyladenylate synthase